MQRPQLATLLSAFSFLGTNLCSAQDQTHAALDSSYGTYGDNGLPFFCQTLDARKLGKGWPADNLTPRGIILHLEHGFHACFDPDLLRLALVWKGRTFSDYLAMNGMAPGSYREPHRKAQSGQDHLPNPIGTPYLANGIYPGWQAGGSLRRSDSRQRSKDKTEVGLGPLPAEDGRWIGVKLDQDGPSLVYEVRGTRIEERLELISTKTAPVLFRKFVIAPHDEPLALAVSISDSVTIDASREPQRVSVTIALGPRPDRATVTREPLPADEPAGEPIKRLWIAEVQARSELSPAAAVPFVSENIPLPLPNPWKRNIRPSDFDFFRDGRLAVATFDGDVWIADGVEHGRERIAWRRFASGLHEPMGLRIVDGQIVVFDRNGLVRLVDRDGNGEADFYENLSSLAAQTAETREFAMGFELKPGGGYYLAKGGQVESTRGKYNGSVLEISADGQELKVVATGLRQPFLGVDPRTGLLTASDQQGHWIPATPINVIKPGHYYGFQPIRLGADANRSKTIAKSPLWIPHFVNQSGARQVWLRDSKMGPLNDSLIHIGYNRPALFKVYLEENRKQGAVVPILQDFPTGLLGGRVNPRDGFLYVGGLNLWGTVGKKVQGLYRVRPTGLPSWIPREVRSFAEGVLLRFDHELELTLATRLSSYTVDRWNYKRTNNYGSGHYKPNGEPGQESLAVSCVYVSEDHQSVFLGIPGMKPVHSLRVSYRLSGNRIDTAYLTVHELHPVNLTNLGFEETAVELTPRQSVDGLEPPAPSAEEGRKVASTYGCVACHSTDGSKKVAEEPDLVVGPAWKGLYGSTRQFTDGTFVEKAAEVYLRESILDPARRVTKGFETGKTGVGMPSYLGVLRDDQIEALILYIKSLK